jgi:phospholipid/cholesterol/gamma-HCH transport system substrate-binding protein
MPSPAKVAWAQLRVGIMALVALSILAVLIFLLTGSGSIFEDKATLKTYMQDSAAMSVSSPVRLNGILVGEISKIEFTGSREPGKVVEIQMRIKRSYLKQIPEDSEAGVSAANLLGDKFINITKGRSSRAIRDGGTLRAEAVQDIPELMARAGDLLGALQVSLRRVDSLLEDVEEGRGNVGKLLKDEALYDRVNATIEETRRAIHTLNTNQGTLGRLLNEDALYQDVRQPIRRLDNLLAALERGEGSAGKLLKEDALYDDARKALGEIRTLLADVNAGKGTAGKLLKDEALHRQITQLLARVDSSLEKINTGQGTLGQLMVNPQLYESLHGSTREMQNLLKDIRANPKKFLRVKLAIF